MGTPVAETDTRRHALPGLGVVSLILATVIVLTSTPAVLAAGLVDPGHPISTVGSQLRRIAASMPVRATSRSARHDEHRPWWPVTPSSRELAFGNVEPQRVGTASVGLGALPLHCLDLPPPALLVA